MDHTEIVKKLIGNISPIGKSEVDRERFENLKAMRELVDNLIDEIYMVHYNNKHTHEHSVKIMADYAGEFIDLKIKLDQ